MPYSQPYHARLLKEEFARRQQANPRYSLRSFAKSVGIHASALSRILAEKGSLSSRAALGVVTKLKLDPKQKRLFLDSVVAFRSRLEKRKVGAASGIPELRLQLKAVNPEDCATVFNLAAHSLLQLALTEDFVPSPTFIAGRLGLPVAKVEELLRSLERFGLIRREGGKITNAQCDFTAVRNDHTDRLRKELQLEIISRAGTAVTEDPFDSRANYSVTTAIDPDRLPRAREMVLEFLETLTDFLEQGPRREVYQLNLNLFRLSRPEAPR